MNSQTSTQTSSFNQVLGICLATFSMFVVGYSATRIYLNQPTTSTEATESNIVAHQATLWSELARKTPNQ